MSVRVKRVVWFWTRATALAAGLVGLTVGTFPVLADEPAEVAIAAPCQSFVGVVKNAVDSARVGLVADNAAFICYVCSQDEAFNQSSARWVRGTVTGGKIEGKSPDGAVTLQGTIGTESAEGSITVGGKVMTFAAALPDERTYAGLYRCEEKTDATDYVAGWVVDEDDFVAGAVQNRQNRQISNPPGVPSAQQKQPKQPDPNPNPKGDIVSPRAGGRNGQQPRGGKQAPNLDAGPGAGVGGQQVTDPKNPATGAGKKFTAADYQAQIQEISTNLEKKGGSPLLAMTIQQVRRFVSGATPSGPLETKTFARLARIPGGTLEKYLKNWDAIPVAARQRILGPAGSQVDPNTPLTGELVKRIAAFGPQSAAAPENSPRVASVRFTQLTCVNPADVRKDEVFYTTLVASGTTGFSNVSETYRGIKKGESRNLSARDSQFWPAANTTAQTSSDIAIGVALFDDDSGVRGAVVNLLRGLGDVAGDIAASFGGSGLGIASGIQNLLEGTAAAVDTARFIGADAIVVKPNKQAVGANGQAKTEMRFLRPGALNTVDYRFKGLLVN